MTVTGTAYVAAGYTVTGVVLGAYWLRLQFRLRAARRRSTGLRRPASVSRRSATAPEQQP